MRLFLLLTLILSSYSYATGTKDKDVDIDIENNSYVGDINNSASLSNYVDQFNRQLANQKVLVQDTCKAELGVASVGEVSHSVSGWCVGASKNESSGWGGSAAWSGAIIPDSVKKARKQQERKIEKEQTDRQLLEQLLRERLDQRKQINLLIERVKKIDANTETGS